MAALRIEPVNEDVAAQAAALRARTDVRLADAIQLTIADRADAPLLTNDRRLATQDAVPVVVLDDLVAAERG